MQEKLADILQESLGRMNEQQKKQFEGLLRDTLPVYIKGITQIILDNPTQKDKGNGLENRTKNRV
jgi:hypothetical protein